MESQWYIYIVKTEKGDRIGIDEYYDNEIKGEYLERGFSNDDEADKRAKEISKEMNIKMYNNMIDEGAEL